MHPASLLDLAEPGGLIQQRQLRVGAGRGDHSVLMWLIFAAAGAFKVSGIAHWFMLRPRRAALTSPS